jgi:hypothetical protein
MSRTLFIASLALTAAGFLPPGVASPAMAQDATYSVRVRNQNNFPVLVKRNGQAPDDSSMDQVGPQGEITVDNIPLASDQIFSAWYMDNSNRCLKNAYILRKDVAAANTISLLIGPDGFAAAQAPKGRPGGGVAPGGNQGGEVYAANLGVYYRPLPQADGTFWVGISRPPVANSPAAQLQFEAGDIITALDGQTFRTPQDVLNHTRETTIDFIDVRTRERRRADVFIP